MPFQRTRDGSGMYTLSCWKHELAKASYESPLTTKDSNHRSGDLYRNFSSTCKHITNNNNNKA